MGGLSEEKAKVMAKTDATIGIDIGGTFTDIVMLLSDGRMFKTKVSSSFSDALNGIIAGVRDLLKDGGIAPAKVGSVIHGTTVATNAILEHKGARTGLLTTAGFRDVLEIGRLRRPSLYDIFWSKPAPLVRRALRSEVAERIASDGAILQQVDLAQVRTEIQALCDRGVESLAVCLLNAYVNPSHERLIAELARREFPRLHLSVSTEILPEIREYERTSTTVINAYIQPVVEHYIDTLISQLMSIGVTCPLHIMQSNGGMIDGNEARKFPVTIVESGPAAGVLASSYLASQTGIRNLISFDMGGTTAKASMIEHGEISVSSEYEVGAGLNSGRRLMKGGGYPIRIPSVDISEVGAGGGSIAWIDSGGAMQVGPHSAGAEPGPACYGAGGAKPTVTDANVVLGYMNPSVLAGGRLTIDARLSYRAIKETLADPLGMNVKECAFGIHTIANANMMRAVRSVSTERGRDPRLYRLVSFGGAGAIHAAGIAAMLNIPEVVIPVSPGLFSAIGLHFADTTRDFVRTFLKRIGVADVEQVRTVLAELKEQCNLFLDSGGFDRGLRDLRFSADLRYLGQAHEINIAIAQDIPNAETLKNTLVEDFAVEHEKLYGHRRDAALVELVNLRAKAIGRAEKVDYRELWDALDANRTHNEEAGRRQAYFGPSFGVLDCTVLGSRRQLGGDTVRGPLIVEEFDTTIVVPPSSAARMDEFGNVLISRV